MKSKNFERELPEGYTEAFTVDAKDKKTVIILNIAVFSITLAIIFLAWFIIKPTDFFDNYSFLQAIILVLVLIVYMVLHEIVHGIAYKAMTGEKLTFGMTLSVAYCGVPNIYVYRKAALVALLAPFTLFTLIFGAAIFILPNVWDKFYAAIVFAIHFGGCSGDLYDTILYLTKFRDPSVLMRDTGPKQTFYKKG